MKNRCQLPRYIWIVAVLVVVVILNIVYFNFEFDFDNIFKVEENLNDQNFGVIAERWIVVDGTNISNDDILKVDDVPEWRILVFGEHITRFKRKRCTNCIFTKDITTRKASTATNIKMASYVHAISHGAKWVYITNQIVNLNKQIEGFHFNETVKGLLYKGQAVFDPDQHFGVKDVSVNATSRQEHVSYLLGDHTTPSVQSKWMSPGYLRDTEYSASDNLACRRPHAIVPAHLFPPMNLMGSLIEYRSFWVLGSLVTEGKTQSLECWWLRLMDDIQETIGIHPPSCEDASSFFYLRHTQTTVNTTQCSPSDTLFTCGIRLANAMVTRGFISQSDVQFLKSWFDTLVTLHYKEPLRENTKKKRNTTGPVHRVVFEPGDVYSSTNKPLGSPFQAVCKPKLPIENTTSVSPVTDILLIVIFNYPTYYSNILYLDYIYRKYFTNILYCGSALDKFSVFHKTYLQPINFIEINEIIRGDFGYMCSAYAMEMGFKVSGYLQISDDVLLNSWNIDALPRDRMWFQHSIRNASILAPRVPNITPLMNDWYWWPWSSSQRGVPRLRQTFAHIELLKKTPEQARAVSFLKHLDTNLGGMSGGFYETSDIFYVPDRYRNNFSFFSKISLAHRLHLEIAIPTMLCGFDDINSIVRLNGTYLWGRERGAYLQLFNRENYFIHPWKWKGLMRRVHVKTFMCTNYLPNILSENVNK